MRPTCLAVAAVLSGHTTASLRGRNDTHVHTACFHHRAHPGPSELCAGPGRGPSREEGRAEGSSVPSGHSTSSTSTGPLFNAASPSDRVSLVGITYAAWKCSFPICPASVSPVELPALGLRTGTPPFPARALLPRGPSELLSSRVLPSAARRLLVCPSPLTPGHSPLPPGLIFLLVLVTVGRIAHVRSGSWYSCTSGMEYRLHGGDLYLFCLTLCFQLPIMSL